MLPILAMLTDEKPEVCCRLTESEYADFLGNMQLMCNLNLNSFITDITPAELMLMYSAAFYAKQQGGQLITVAQAAVKLRISVPAVSRTLKNLEKRGLVQRIVNEQDRRSVKISLPESGMELLLCNLRRLESSMSHILSCFTDDELREMIRLQSKFINAVAAESSK